MGLGRGVVAKVLVYVSYFRLLGCFLLVYFGGAVLVIVVTGGKLV